MINDAIQHEWFLPCMILLGIWYYLWVLISFFQFNLPHGLAGLGKKSSDTLRVSWDELTLGFSLHRRLLADPQTSLDAEEQALLQKTPFKELIRQTTGFKS